jgi:hypothetical protein
MSAGKPQYTHFRVVLFFFLIPEVDTRTYEYLYEYVTAWANVAVKGLYMTSYQDTMSLHVPIAEHPIRYLLFLAGIIDFTEVMAD